MVQIAATARGLGDQSVLMPELSDHLRTGGDRYALSAVT
jgi:hypothetical protein